jgi:hypothetical protein
MSRATVIVRSKADRDRIARWAQNVPNGTRVEFKEVKRSLPQNDAMWAALTDIARQLKWHGLTLDTDDWKLIFLDALKREVRMVPNLDNNGFVSLGRSSSDLSKNEMSDLLSLIYEFGARHGVVFNDQQSEGQAA